MSNVHIMSCSCQNNIIQNDLSRFDYRYRVQTGLFRSYNKAMDFQLQLMEEGYLADIDQQGNIFAVITGDYSELEGAVMLERYLRFRGYNTVVIAV
ncbi:MAG: hypothetical protein PHF63_12975 [Herbinix sp.]|nr:hypothetical protein [Herbinix sp.]